MQARTDSVRDRHPEKNAVAEHGVSIGIDVEVVARNPGVRGFHVAKRRWVVQRSIGVIMMPRRLALDYEALPANSGAVIRIASIGTSPSA